MKKNKVYKSVKFVQEYYLRTCTVASYSYNSLWLRIKVKGIRYFDLPGLRVGTHYIPLLGQVGLQNMIHLIGSTRNWFPAYRASLTRK